jgi:hypothetical protein
LKYGVILTKRSKPERSLPESLLAGFSGFVHAIGGGLEFGSYWTHGDVLLFKQSGTSNVQAPLTTCAGMGLLAFRF